MSEDSDDDDVPEHLIERPEDVVKFTEQWIRDNESEVERLAAETGTAQERTIGIAVEPKQKLLLQVHIACEPRQFATRSVTGEWAKLFRTDAKK